MVIVDNSPPSESAASITNTIHLTYPSNVGIAGAQNAGLRALIESGCDACLLLDQDSFLDTSQILMLAKEFRRIKSHNDNIVAIGPRIYCEFEKRILVPKGAYEPSKGCGYHLVPQIIASGMLIDVRKLPLIGFKEESLFIDAVDHEWCWRAAAHGYEVAQTDRVVMRHRQGDARLKVGPIYFKVGAPIRLYYQTRNLCLLLTRPYVPLRWKIRNLVALPLRLVVNSLLMPERKSRFLYMLRGIAHGILRRRGRLESR